MIQNSQQCFEELLEGSINSRQSHDQENEFGLSGTGEEDDTKSSVDDQPISPFEYIDENSESTGKDTVTQNEGRMMLIMFNSI